MKMNTIKAKKIQSELKNNNEYLICFKNVIHVLKILAIFPFIRFSETTKSGRLFSTIVTIISLTIYVFMIANEEKYLYNTYFYIRREVNFTNSIRFILQLVLRSALLVYPFLTWNKNSYLRNYWDNWMTFQTKMGKVTKTPFKFSTAQYQIQGLFFISNISMTVIGVMIMEQQHQIITLNLYTILYMLYNLANVSTYWIFNNFFIVAVAKKITNLVQQTIREGNVVHLGHLIDLWIMLCDLNDQFINVHSIVFLIMFSMMVIGAVISVFATVFVFVYYNEKDLGLTYLFAALNFMIGIMVFCESGNSVVDHMVHKLKKQLLDEKLDIENRTLLKVILSAIINFLVVLKQFSPD